MKKELMMLLATMATFAAFANPYTWTGGGADATSWNDENNWDPAGVPGGGDTATFTSAATIADGIVVSSGELKIYANAAAVAALEENAGLGLRDARIYDVRIENSEEDLVDILTPVRLMVTYADAMSIDEESSINLVSFNTYEPRAYSPGAVEGGDEIAALSFTADASAVYAVAEVGTLEAKVLTADGAGYNVTVSYGIDAHIPKGATLEVSEIPADSPEYEEYRSLAENAAVRAAGEEVGTARLFDIAIMYEGREVQPDVPVDVRIDFDDSIEKAEEEEFRMVHLGEGSTDVLDVSLQGDLKESGMDVDGVMFSNEFNRDLLRRRMEKCGKDLGRKCIRRLWQRGLCLDCTQLRGGSPVQFPHQFRPECSDRGG